MARLRAWARRNAANVSARPFWTFLRAGGLGFANRKRRSQGHAGCLSPAKKLDMTPVDGVTADEPEFSRRGGELAGVAGADRWRAAKADGISESLARLNADASPISARWTRKPAALAFAGDTYQGLEAGSLDPTRWLGAGSPAHPVGALRAAAPARRDRALPAGDGQPPANRGDAPFTTTGATRSRALNAGPPRSAPKLLVNCASQEYFGAVDTGALGCGSSRPFSWRTTRRVRRSSASTPRRRAARWPASSSSTG